ncbi:Colicin V production protein [Streptoalloteichus tenebrarius]|uniref:Colicin V production protein n=1 Tax=Streptoalloteichus tenebrarius (strain ATCC 17920 / DSM 40477 / JCM 4838 / CBS 697.72 / NBRC 16177 / NCIMB 11028 / NRRL B-12390 / A12253. 1 / ISP 5477) TaxID=1933 RepID=A0ABT1HR67_STRSD|nr:MarP family serine protease [Streptoalloteichus tenebrarius]MCP2258003.1 Colicin V production protein [Streptoalloteichus tenebrarius]BFF01671.1 MarP family serine protease [Streptoalloteichus tenebrarius]
MNWIDLVVVLLALLAAVSGARQGVLIALPAFVGVLAGVVLGLWLAPQIVSHFDNVVTRVALGVAVLVLLIALGETLGVWLGRTLRDRITSRRLAGVDNVLGAVVQGLVVFVVAWLVALPLTNAPGLPGLTSALKGSRVLGTVDSAMPSAARQLPDDLRKLLDVSGFPAALAPFANTPVQEVQPPNPELQQSPTVQRVRASVVKIRGKAPSCSRALEGTGFVVSPERVMTNAHVVAGTDEVAVEIGRGKLPAKVVHYDAGKDVAVLAVPDLTARPLEWAPGEARSGQDGIVLGYPLDGPYTASEARVREKINLKGPDIYEARTVQREVYTVRATVRSGNSGGPLVDTEGRVLGVVFGAAVDNRETGFVLTAAEVAQEVRMAPQLTTRQSTGSCAA